MSLKEKTYLDDTPLWNYELVLLWYLLLHRYPLSSHWSMAVSASSLSSSQTANGKKMRVNDWTNRWRRTWSNALVSSYEEKQSGFYDRKQSASIIAASQMPPTPSLTVSYLRFQRQAAVEEDERDGNVGDGDLWL